MGTFNVNMSTIFDQAEEIFNALMPIAAIAIGLSLGVGLIGLVIRLVRGAFSGIGG